MRKIAFILVAVILVLPSVLWADTAITLTNYANYNNNTWTLGFEFTPTQNIYVTALGSYFPQGATTIHNAAIWTTGGSLLAYADVVGTGTEGFAYTGITPLALLAGTTYVVGANTLTDDYADIGATWTVGPYLTYVDHVEIVCGTAAACFPTHHYTDFGDFGANFQYNAVPEPGSMLLLGSGLFGLAGAIRRKFSR